ncbi:hypothetical protein ACLOJK_035145 [Asimina triloba]
MGCHDCTSCCRHDRSDYRRSYPVEDAVRSRWPSAAASSDGDRCLKMLFDRLGFGHGSPFGRTMLGCRSGEDIADLLLDFRPLFAAANRWMLLKFGFAEQPNRYPDARRSAVDHV